MDLYNDIVQLLKENDCVIIPNFGGFIINYNSAVINIEKQEFKPPSIKIAFNSNLQNNDGLLFNYLCRTYNYSWQEAENQVYTYINNLQEILKEKKKIEFGELGNFQSIENKLMFVANENNSLNNCYYALNSFVFPLLNTNYKSVIQQNKPQILNNKKQKKSVKNKILIPISAVAAIFIIVYLSFNINLFNIQETNKTLSNILDFNSLQQNHTNIDNPTITDTQSETSTKENITNIDSITNSNIITEQITVDETIEPIINDSNKDNDTYKIHIVAGCFSNIENANNLYNEFIAAGFQAKLLHKNNEMTKVVIKSFPDINSALLEINDLKEKINNDNLWIYKE